MKRLIIAGVVALVLVVTGCSHYSSASHPGLYGKVRCGVSIGQWYKQSGRAEVKTLESQFRPMLAAARAHKTGALKQDAANVENATKTVKGNMPPNCVPGADTQLTTALTDVNSAAKAASAKHPNTSVVQTDLKSAEQHTGFALLDVKKFAEG